MKYEAVKEAMLSRLENELSPQLSYHSVLHVKDVLQAAEDIAHEEGIEGNALMLLKTAALFHDSGFLYGSKDHEQKSCDIARNTLPYYNYTEAQIEKICGMIMATKIPQSPKNHLEEILADADLDYLGRDDFFSIGNGLFEELSIFGLVHNELDWNKLQIKFLENHHYFTATAIKKRKEKKESHLQYLKQEVAKYEQS